MRLKEFQIYMNKQQVITDNLIWNNGRMATESCPFYLIIKKI